jgi:hypothetical protein
VQAASFSRSWPPRSCVDTSEPNRFTGSRKEFCELNSGAWIWTVNRFLAQQSAATDGKSVDGTNRATPDDELDGG